MKLFVFIITPEKLTEKIYIIPFTQKSRAEIAGSKLKSIS
jgi:hypothetical protein